MPHYVALIVLGCWLSFGVLFAVRSRVASSEATQRDWRGMLGALIQAIGFALAWSHPTLYPNRQGVLVSFAAPLAIASVAVGLWAIHTLGSSWSIQARLTKDHHLVTDGPYRLVRHPIYTSFLGLLIATGIVFGDHLLVAIVLYLIGVKVRIGAEEALLRSRFGGPFDAYVKRTPAVLPFPWRRSPL